MSEVRRDAERAEGRLDDRRRRAVTIGAIVGLVLGVVACVAMNRIYYGGTVRWGNAHPL
ncbi:MAG: hypothetical protein LC793_08905 [Thermomicrobia bacterium]|nr:hypothetical protein [Thermomicrobia bacterium]